MRNGSSERARVTGRTYCWRGRNADGAPISGRLEAHDRNVALALLLHQGVVVSRLRRERRWPGVERRGIRSGDVNAFIRQLATLQQAGLPLTRSLELIAESQANPALRSLIETLDAVVREGGRLSDALTAHPRHFSPVVRHLVAAGESAGQLDMLLGRIADHLERLESIKAGVRSALVYPAAVCVVAVLVSVLLLWLVVPTFADLFSAFDAQLPALTLVVMRASDGLRDHAALILGGLVVASIGTSTAWRRMTVVRQWALGMALHLPLIGPILRASALARFSQTLGMLYRAGIPLLDALESVAAITGHPIYHRAVLAARSAIAEGLSLHSALQAQGLFPDIMLQLIAIGEESGRLDDMLDRLASSQSADVDARVRKLTSAVEPLIMTVLGCAVGTLMIAMYLPVFQMGSVF